MIRDAFSRIPRLARPLVVAGALGALAYGVWRLFGSGRRADWWNVDRASEFRERFHWGNPTEAIVTRRVSKSPRTAVKLGTLEGVVYRTNKRGHGVTSYFHDFEGTQPDLLMDIDNRRLHIAGGDYDVTEDGITG